MNCRHRHSCQNNWLIARWGKRAVVRDEKSVTRRMTQLWSRQGTHQVCIHAILNLEDPVDEIILFTLEIGGVLGVLDGAIDTKHACSCPAITWTGEKRDENKTSDKGEGSRQTYGPVTRILAVAQGHVPPEVSGALVAQVLAIECDLVETLGNCGPISGHDTIVSEERGDHVDEVGP